ncbi:MAG TPA: hypothetical protein VHS55_00255 [Solirubrobacteraceae bacterium]|jgi:hypothetical protein|nr:hypothetical protein [Solirubrobacteraceae bacterium]
MTTQNRSISAERLEILRWTASLGAITAEALAVRQAVPVVSARGRLSAQCRRGLLARSRPLSERPALFTLTAAGARAAGLPGLASCRVRPSNASHLIACALAAASLQRCYPDQRVLGERELRHSERACGHPLASARLVGRYAGCTGLHRPDLVLAPVAEELALPVAVEVELSVKAPRRLSEICRAWARCPQVEGVLYLVSEQVQPAVRRAVAAARAGERIAVVRLDALENRLTRSLASFTGEITSEGEQPCLTRTSIA